jgi:hypothetical protein
MMQINEIVLRVPGLNTHEGNQLAGEVASRLFAMMPEASKDHYIEEVNIRIPKENYTLGNGLADHIARQIWTQINLK